MHGGRSGLAPFFGSLASLFRRAVDFYGLFLEYCFEKHMAIRRKNKSKNGSHLLISSLGQLIIRITIYLKFLDRVLALPHQAFPIIFNSAFFWKSEKIETA